MDYANISKEGFKFFVEQVLYSEKNIAPELLCAIYLRISQINKCSYCIDLHSKECLKFMEQKKINLICAFEKSSLFSKKEKAVLRLTENITYLNANYDVNELKEFFNEKQIVDIVFAISNINALNRIAISLRREHD
jgi:AhpD family alkylhydroperoxidase